MRHQVAPSSLKHTLTLKSSLWTGYVYASDLNCLYVGGFVYKS